LGDEAGDNDATEALSAPTQDEIDDWTEIRSTFWIAVSRAKGGNGGRVSVTSSSCFLI
jgi:hypothetical protein